MRKAESRKPRNARRQALTVIAGILCALVIVLAPASLVVLFLKGASAMLEAGEYLPGRDTALFWNDGKCEALHGSKGYCVVFRTGGEDEPVFHQPEVTLFSGVEGFAWRESGDVLCFRHSQGCAVVDFSLNRSFEGEAVADLPLRYQVMFADEGAFRQIGKDPGE